MKNKLLITLSTVVLFALSSRSQNSITELPVNMENARIAKSTKLTVVLLEENEDYVEKMRRKNKTAELAKYSSAIRNYNMQISDLVKDLMPFMENVEFKNLSQIKDMPKEERRQSNYLAYNIGIKITAQLTAATPAYDFYGKSVYSPIDNKSYDFEDRSAGYGKLEIYSYDKKESGNFKLLYMKTLPHSIPSNGDVAYWLNRANSSFQDVNDNEEKVAWKRKLKDNGHILKEKTLLICKDDLDKTTNAGSIKKVYPYTFKIVSKDEFDKAIIAKENDKCILMLLPIDSPANLIVHEVTDLESGLLLALGSAKQQELEASHLKKLAESVQ
jgi:hypothetical protein